MKRYISLITALILCIALFGCAETGETPSIAATTLPVWEFTTILCEGTGIRVNRLITESVSCLHDYTLQVSQMRQIEAAEHIVISGAGLEDFLEEAIETKSVIDASRNIHLTCSETHHDHGHDHSHDSDPHIWLSPENAKQMAGNICEGLIAAYPAHTQTFRVNLRTLEEKLDALSQYASEALTGIQSRELVTFHDGFSYMAEAFDLTILHAIEEESGSEASAKELIGLVKIVRAHNVKAIFIEENGSVSAASIIASETGAKVCKLDMAMSGNSYFDAMYHNIDTLKEALE